MKKLHCTKQPDGTWKPDQYEVDWPDLEPGWMKYMYGDYGAHLGDSRWVSQPDRFWNLEKKLRARPRTFDIDLAGVVAIGTECEIETWTASGWQQLGILYEQASAAISDEEEFDATIDRLVGRDGTIDPTVIQSELGAKLFAECLDAMAKRVRRSLQPHLEP